MGDSPLDLMLANQLPGLGDQALPAPCSDEELERIPVFSATRLREADPARYALAAGLFFGERLSTRQICRYARVSPHTLKAIILAEIGSRTAEQWSADLVERLRAGATLAADALGDMLLDEIARSQAGIRGVASALRELSCAHAAATAKPGQSHSDDPQRDESAARAYLERITPAAPMDSEGGKEGNREGVEEAGAEYCEGAP